jgi:hypothetical protein
VAAGDGSTFDAPHELSNQYAAELRNLARGECFTRRGNRTSRERITPIPVPFGLSKETLVGVMNGQLSVVKQRPEYYSPDEPADHPPTEPSPPEGRPAETDDGPFGV